MGSSGKDVSFLIELGKAIGLLSESGAVQDDWLQGPAANSKGIDPQRRTHLKNALAVFFGAPDALADLPPLELPSDGGDPAGHMPAGAWYKAHPQVPVHLILGEAEDDPRFIGVGGRLSSAGPNPAVRLAVQGWLAGLTGPDFILPPTDPRMAPPVLAQASITVGAGPVKSLELAAAISGEGLADLALGLVDSTGHVSPPLNLTPESGTEGLLEAAHLALFLIRATLRDAAQKGNPTAQKLVAHLLPLLGSSEDGPQPNPIPPFPIDALLDGTPHLIDWMMDLFPAPAAFGDPSRDAVAAILTHLRALLAGVNLPPAPGDGWTAWLEPSGATGRAAFFADGDATLLTLGIHGEREAVVDGVRLRLEARSQLLTASVVEGTLTGADGILARATLSSSTPGALLAAVDLGALLGQPDMSGKGILRLEIEVRSHAGRGLDPDCRAIIAHPDGSGEDQIDVQTPLLVDAGALVVAALPAGAPVRQVLETLFTELPLDLWLVQAGTVGATKVINALKALAARMLNQPPGALVTLPLGSAVPFNLELGVQGGTAGVRLVPANMPAAAIRFDGASVAGKAQDSLSAHITGAISSPLFDAFPVRPALRFEVQGDGLPALSLLLRDGNGNPALTWGLAPSALPPLKEVLTTAIPLLLWMVRDAPALKEPLGAGLCLGKLLQLGGLGTWNGTVLEPASPAALAALTPLSVVTGAISGLLGQSGAGWTAAGPLEWQAWNSGGSLGVALRSKGGAPLIDEPQISLGYSKLVIQLLEQSQGGLSFSPGLKLEALAVTAHGEDKAALLDAGPLSLGSATLSTGFSVGDPAFVLDGVALTLSDLRLPFGGGSSMASQFLPSGQGPGFDVTVGWTPGGLEVDINGQPSFWFDIDRRIGPLEVERIGVTWLGAGNLQVSLDANFELGGIRIQPDGLGIVIPLEHLTEPDAWDFTLRGLGLSFDQGGIQISGLLRNNNGDFQGAALVHAYSFQLGAIGAYKQLADGPSLFLFAALAAPLGGPPWFFITGVAGGFGYNRAFEVPDDVNAVAKLPFFGLMKGDLDLSQIQTIGDLLDTWLRPQRDTLWLAGGLTFTSFALIKGQALLYVVIGPHFELGLMALCSFQVPKIVNIELALKARFTTAGDDPNLLVMGGLTDKSWLLGGACRLEGGFALQAWFGSGDCVLTVGGYSPDFKKPERYPTVDRLSFRWALADAIVLKGDSYFALTPREAMGGSHFEVSGHWGPLSAGYRCWFDALVGWDPFYFVASLDVGLWGKVETPLGDIEIEVGVHLKVHGPPLGGIAGIDLAIISIDVPFGDQSPPRTDPMPVGAFLSRMLELRLPASQEKLEHLTLPARSVLNAQGEVLEHGLLGIEVQKGLISEDGTAAEGTQARPWILAPEFQLLIRSRVPLASPGALFSAYMNVFDAVVEPKFSDLDFYPCQRGGLSSVIDVVYGGSLAGKPKSSAFVSPLPEALFGEGPEPGNDDVTRPRCVGIQIDGTATLAGALSGDHALGQRFSTPGQRLPLPLGSAGRPLSTLSQKLGTPVRMGKAKLEAKIGDAAKTLRMAAAPRVVGLDAGIIEGSDAPLAGLPVFQPPLPPSQRPAHVRGLAQYFLPRRKGVALPVTRVGDSGLGVARVQPPRPVTRGVALAGVTLRRAPLPGEARGRPGRPLRAGPLKASGELLTRMALELTGEGTTLKAGTAEVFALEGRYQDARLSLDGDQPVRFVALDAYGGLLADQQLEAGARTVSVPSRARRLVLIGLGVPYLSSREAPRGEPREEPRGGGRTPMAHASAPPGIATLTPLIPVGGQTWIGPGCVLRIRRGAAPSTGPDTPLGGKILPAGELLEATFPGATSGTVAFILSAVSDGGEGVPLAEQVRWEASTALGAPKAVVGIDRIALLFDVGVEAAPARTEGKTGETTSSQTSGQASTSTSTAGDRTSGEAASTATKTGEAASTAPVTGEAASTATKTGEAASTATKTGEAASTASTATVTRLTVPGEAGSIGLRASLELLGGYRLEALALLPGAAATHQRLLASSSRWDLTDRGEVYEHGRTRVRLEVRS